MEINYNFNLLYHYQIFNEKKFVVNLTIKNIKLLLVVLISNINIFDIKVKNVNLVTRIAKVN